MNILEKKIALIRKESITEWKSCVEIMDSLEKTYLSLESLNLKLFYTDQLKEIARFAPDTVICIDHRLNFEHIVGAINSVVDRPIEWIFHIFGCFPQRITELYLANTRMKELDTCKVIAASDSYCAIAKNFIENGSEIIFKFRFPFTKSSEDPGLFNKEIHQKYDIKVSDKVLIYAGRISFQKNVPTLIKLLREYAEKQNSSIKLFVCGEADDLNPYVKDGSYVFGFAKEQYEQEIAKKSEHFEVISTGQLEYPELEKFYHAADLFISLSTYHGEDFGHAIAEALASGLPCILTRWGGYKDFGELSQVSLVEVKKMDDWYEVNKEMLFKLLDQKLASNVNKNEISLEFLSKYNYQNKKDKLYAILSAPSSRLQLSQVAIAFHSKKNWTLEELNTFHNLNTTKFLI